MSNNKNRLYLSQDKVVAGVAGGVGNYFGIDPAIIRIIWALLIFAKGIGVLAYIIGAIIIPESPNDTINYSDNQNSNAFQDGVNKVRGSVDRAINGEDNAGALRIIGVILVVIGAAFLLRDLLPGFPWRLAWPIGLILVGLYIMSRNK